MVAKSGDEEPIDEAQNEMILAMVNELGELRTAVQQSHDDAKQMWAALGSVVGISEMADGMAHVAEMLGPLKQLVPQVVSGELNPGVEVANIRMREALGLVLRDKKGNPLPGGLRPFDRLPTDEWEQPVAFIGQA